MAAFWATAKNELHEHETLIYFKREEDRDAFVSDCGGVGMGFNKLGRIHRLNLALIENH